MIRAGADGSSGRPPRPMGRAADEVDDDGWLGEADEPPPPAPDPPPAPAVTRSGASRLTDDEVAEHYAGHISGTVASAVMYMSMAGVFRDAGPLAYKKFRDKLLAECGGPADPVEVMLIEQLALAHMNTGRLYAKAAMTEGLEAARTYGALAVALAGEVRRTALALKEYRARPVAAPAGAGPAASAGRTGAGGEVGTAGVDGEEGSKPGDEAHGADDTIPLPEPASGRGRATKPAEARRAQRRRA